MQLTCPRCHHVLEFSGDRPSFCGYCGSALAETKALTPVDPEAPTLAPHPAAAAEAPAPEVVGGYRLLRRLGGGGMGTVYEAQDIASGRRVALKLISPQYAASPDAVERFRQEGRLASTIAHPRCVFVLAADEDAGRPYIVMELMPGDTLEDQVAAKGPLAPDDAIDAILDVIDGLEEAHRHGVIHRDVKPSNCFLDGDGRVKVGDFGLSKSLAGNVRLTRTGAFLGTPLYASPEQVKGEPLDPQTDVYSVAATLYYMLTGRAPFQSSDMAATVARIVSDPPPPMRSLRPDLDPRLDQVVLQGLERDRSRRWRDLAEFRAALQEFLPGGLSIGGLGIRFGAAVLDYLVLFFNGTAFGIVWLALTGVEGVLSAEYDLRGQAFRLAGVLPALFYFALPEGLWGCSLAKLLLRLRVRRAGGSAPPGLARGFIRAAVWVTLLNLGAILWVVGMAVFLPADTRLDQAAMRSPIKYTLLSLLPVAGMLAGVGLALLPMRRRNGYRGLHEFLSGTRVVLLPPAARHTALRGDHFEPPLRPAEGLPERLGAFEVRGAVGGAGATVLAGRDCRLGRDAWIWLRPLSDPPLGDARRQLSRTARPRWLACGTHGVAQWDAFIAPTGTPLPEMVRRQGRFGWPEVRPLLEGLTDELTEASAEGTVPDVLRPEQVWVQPNGAAQLLDMPWSGGPATEASAAGPADEGPAKAAERRGLALLGQVAALALEGAPRGPMRPGPIREEEIKFLGRPGTGPLPAPAEPIRAPLPRHAADLLRRLLTGPGTCRKFRSELRETRYQPAEVTRARRFGHVALLTALLFVGLGCCMFPAGWLVDAMPGMMRPALLVEEERSLHYFDEGSWRDFAASAAGTGPACWPALGQLCADRELHQRLADKVEADRRRHEAQLEVLGPISQQQALMIMKGQKDQEALMETDPRFQALTQMRRSQYRQGTEELLAGGKELEQVEAVVRGVALAPLLVWPLLWVVWAFLLRGGLSYRVAGIDLVRSDGRPAWRLQCAWRALLVWAPLAGLLVLSLWLQIRFWSAWDRGELLPGLHALSTVLWYAALALPVVYLAVGLARPARALHDVLAGTYLVPR